jgi:hypothetical protein
MERIESTGFAEIDRLIELVARTRLLLDAVVDRGVLPKGGADFLAARTLPHLEEVRAGFRGALRSDWAGLAELQYVILQDAELRAALRPPSTPAERRAALLEAVVEERAQQRQRRPAIRGARLWPLIALAHARIVFALLPRLPSTAVRFPWGPRTYADIPVPRGPAELVQRIDELERELWWTATGRLPHPGDPALRRTYGFFDVADQITGRAFGVVS